MKEITRKNVEVLDAVILLVTVITLAVLMTCMLFAIDPQPASAL